MKQQNINKEIEFYFEKTETISSEDLEKAFLKAFKEKPKQAFLQIEIKKEAFDLYKNELINYNKRKRKRK